MEKGTKNHFCIVVYFLVFEVTFNVLKTILNFPASFIQPVFIVKIAVNYNDSQSKL